MYSNKKNILQLVALLKAFGIRHLVLSPGSRNSPIIHSIATDPFFTSHTVVDERSAGFVGIGIIQKTHEAVAVCCTSGTAVLNLGSAVAEAFYQQLPLLVITADRPLSWIGQMDGQTIPQPNAFQSFVKKSIQLPEPATKEEEWYCNRLINEALLELNHRGFGPVHINIPISEPLFEYTEKELPEVRKINRVTLSENGLSHLKERFAHFTKRMILIGQQPQNKISVTQLEQLQRKHPCVILAEHLSNVQSPCVIGNFDSMLYSLSSEERKAFAPDLVVTLGGHLVSKQLKQFLRHNPPTAHWHISPDGEVVDLFQCITDILEGNAANAINGFAESHLMSSAQSTEYAALWANYSTSMNAPSIPFSDIHAVKELMHSIPKQAALHLANSLSVRFAQLFALNKEIHVSCNRGTNGIDGSLSAAVGYASVNDRLTFLVLGDLSFFYDMNALWNRGACKNIRILLNNNGGGEIFYTLPGLNLSEGFEKHIAASHATQAKAWAESVGFLYLSASDEKELTANLAAFVSEQGDKPILMEVFSSMKQNATILKQYYQDIKTN